MWISKKKYLEMKEMIQDLKEDKKILQTVCEKYKTDLEKKPATIYIREPYPGTQKDAKQQAEILRNVEFQATSF